MDLIGDPTALVANTISLQHQLLGTPMETLLHAVWKECSRPESLQKRIVETLQYSQGREIDRGSLPSRVGTAIPLTAAAIGSTMWGKVGVCAAGHRRMDLR